MLISVVAQYEVLQLVYRSALDFSAAWSRRFAPSTTSVEMTGFLLYFVNCGIRMKVNFSSDLQCLRKWREAFRSFFCRCGLPLQKIV
jgi:hypothetical protein